jgi:hypothetical protein
VDLNYRLGRKGEMEEKRVFFRWKEVDLGIEEYEREKGFF